MHIEYRPKLSLTGFEAFPDWVPNDVLQAAKALSVEDDALTELPAYFRRS